MGLALDNSIPDALDALTEHRHLPPGKAFNRPKARPSAHRTNIWRVRHETTELVTQGHEDPYPGQRRPHELRPYQLVALAAHHRTSPEARGGFIRHQTRRRWASADDDEGRDLARSNVPLPSDGARLGEGRPPSLERQGAFRDARTAKRAPSRAGQVDDAELYRLGLLYDDEHERGSGFGLGAIVHDGPACYTLRVRPSKRQLRKRNARVEGDMPLGRSAAVGPADDAWSEYLMTPDAEGVCGDSTPSPSAARLDLLYESHLGTPEHPPDLIFDDVSENEEGDDDDWFIMRRVVPPDDGEADEIEDRGGRESPTDPWIVLG